ncbi:hypothetical protein DFH27DRAFT_606365 [Peziza echinospora]|nr:hypothetical protein DFH27DRAFT_606365 [Peziza echinospora]
MPSFTGGHRQQQQQSQASSSRYSSRGGTAAAGSSGSSVRTGRAAETYFLRTESRYQKQNSDREDSWIEVDSQPSDDTYSSDTGSDDDDFQDGSTGGLMMHQGLHQRTRRKRKNRRVEIPLAVGKSVAATTAASTATSPFDHSSADDLSEIEMIGSSGPGSSIGELPTAEDLESSSSAAGEDGSSEEGVIEDSSDGEDTGTMLGVGHRSSFQHAGNKSNSTAATGIGGSSGSTGRVPASSRFSSTQSVYEFQRTIQAPSQSFLRHRNSHGGGSSSSGRYLRPSPPPATKADHDEALMASLSTLLSVAAAARSLPKVAQQGSPSGPSRAPTMSSSRVQLDTLQLVPNEVMSEKETSPGPTSDENRVLPPASSSASTTKEEQTQRLGRQQEVALGRTSSSTSISSTSRASRSSKKPTATDPGKKSQRSSSKGNHTRRRSTSPKSTSHKRDYKLTSTLSSADASLVTLALAAGGVILLSAISFSAGYAMGREVGKTEADAVVGAVVGRGGGVARGGGRGLVVGSVGRVVSVGA